MLFVMALRYMSGSPVVIGLQVINQGQHIFLPPVLQGWMSGWLFIPRLRSLRCGSLPLSDCKMER